MMDWVSFNFYRDWGYNLCYPQLFDWHKRPSDEGQRVVVEWGRDKSVFWLQVLDDHWLGDGRTWLTGEAITVADYYVGGLVALGDIIRWDFSKTPNVQRWLGRVKALPSWKAGQRGAGRLRGLARRARLHRGMRLVGAMRVHDIAGEGRGGAAFASRICPATNSRAPVECAPVVGQDQAAVLTGWGALRFSNSIGLR